MPRVDPGKLMHEKPGQKSALIVHPPPCSTQTGAVPASGVVGIKQRIQFTMAKDAGHLGNSSPWVQFRVTS